MDNLSDRLKNLRISHGLKQKDIAQLLDLTSSAYGFYEQGKRTPSLDILINISRYYKVSLDWLITGSENFGNNLIISDDNEKYLIEKYRKLDNSDKIKIEGMIELKLTEKTNKS